MLEERPLTLGGYPFRSEGRHYVASLVPPEAKEAIKLSQPHLSEVASEMPSIDPSLTPEHLDILLGTLPMCTSTISGFAPPYPTAGGLKNEELLKGVSSCVDNALADLIRPWNADNPAERRGGVFNVPPLCGGG